MPLLLAFYPLCQGMLTDLRSRGLLHLKYYSTQDILNVIFYMMILEKIDLINFF